MQGRDASAALWRPGNFLAALGIWLLRGMACLPVPVLQKMGRALGLFVWYVAPYRKGVVLTNLRLCFPEWGEKERRRVAREHYASAGVGAFELGLAWYAPPEKLEPLVDYEGLEHIEAVRQSGRGALLVTGHFTCMELTGRMLTMRIPCGCLWRPLNQPRFRNEMQRIRTKYMDSVLPFQDTRAFIRILREGRNILYTPDQGKRIKYSNLLPFFGIPAITNTATGRIARMGRAAIVPFYGYRKPDGRYRVVIEAERTDLPSEDPDADGLETNKMIERSARAAPEQYFWMHKRFKARGPAYPDVYASRTNEDLSSESARR